MLGRRDSALLRCNDANQSTLRGKRNMSHILVEREISPEEQMPPDYLEPIKALWIDEGVSAAIAKGNEYALHDNLQ